MLTKRVLIQLWIEFGYAIDSKILYSQTIGDNPFLKRFVLEILLRADLHELQASSPPVRNVRRLGGARAQNEAERLVRLIPILLADALRKPSRVNSSVDGHTC